MDLCVPLVGIAFFILELETVLICVGNFAMDILSYLYGMPA